MKNDWIGQQLKRLDKGKLEPGEVAARFRIKALMLNEYAKLLESEALRRQEFIDRTRAEHPSFFVEPLSRGESGSSVSAELSKPKGRGKRSRSKAKKRSMP